MRLGILVLALLVTFPTAAYAEANASQEVSRARGQYAAGEYQKVVDILYPQLYPRPLINSAEELAEAHKLLGIAYFYLEKRDLAYAEFLALLSLEPRYELDPVENSPDVYAFYDTVKRENRDRLDKIAKQRETERETERERQRQASRVVTITREYYPQETWRHWLPLGGGQFANGESRMGTFFAISQGALGGATLGAFAYQLLRFGFDFRQPFTVDETNLIYDLQVTQIASGVGFLALYGWSVFDAYAHQKPRFVETRREDPLPGTTPTSSSRLMLMPILTSDAVGAGATWSF